MSSFTEILALSTRFDGTSHSQTFISDFERTRVLYEKDEKWAILAFSKFLDGDATNWWIASRKTYDADIVAKKEPEGIWERIKEDFVLAFPECDTVKRAKSKCRERSLRPDETASTYVRNKLALMELWKPHDEKKKLKELMRGLPERLRLSMSVANHSSVELFRSALDNALQVCDVPHPPVPPTWPQSRRPQSSSPAGEAVKKPLPKTEDGTPVCLYCQRPGHFKRSCRKFATERPEESAALRQRRGEPPLVMNKLSENC
jgi:hypothetical protein